jgi:hypothetical protein
VAPSPGVGLWTLLGSFLLFGGLLSLALAIPDARTPPQ